ncbi:MAG: hypothetical protein ABI874_04505, partial [Chloroflexota bacterium]
AMSLSAPTRFQTASQMSSALFASSQRQITPAPQPVQPNKRAGPVIVLGGFGALLLIGIIVLSQGGKPIIVEPTAARVVLVSTATTTVTVTPSATSSATTTQTPSAIPSAPPTLLATMTSTPLPSMTPPPTALPTSTSTPQPTDTTVPPTNTQRPPTATFTSNPASTATPVPILFPAVTLVEPKNGQIIQGNTARFQYVTNNQAYNAGYSHLLFLRRKGRPVWEFRGNDSTTVGFTVKIGQEILAVSDSKRVLWPGYGEYEWTVFILDRAGEIFSAQGEARRFVWTADK